MISAKIQNNIFLNAVPWKYSKLGTWLIVIHSMLGLTGAPLLLYMYEATGRSSDVKFLFLFGSLGTLLGLLNVVGIITVLKLHRTLGQTLLLLVYLVGSLFSTWVIFPVVTSPYFSILGIFNPIGLLFLFFFSSGWYTLVIIGLALGKGLTRDEGKYCYYCSTAFKKTNEYCENCGGKLVLIYLEPLKNKTKQENETI